MYKRQGLKTAVTYENSSEVPKNQVIGQDPVANSSTLKNAVVRLKVSKGIELVQVPDLAGLSMVEAIDAIEKKGLIFGKCVVESSSKMCIRDSPLGSWCQNFFSSETYPHPPHALYAIIHTRRARVVYLVRGKINPEGRP